MYRALYYGKIETQIYYIHKLKSQNIKLFYDGEKELSSALVSERPKIWRLY